MLRKSYPLTPARVAANRRNAQNSTGPRTAEGKARARLNRLRHGRRSPLFARFKNALLENPSDARGASKRLLRPEETRHPLFARWIKDWGLVWTRAHAYQLTGRRKLKRLGRLLNQPDSWYDEQIRYIEELKRLGSLYMRLGAVRPKLKSRGRSRARRHSLPFRFGPIELKNDKRRGVPPIGYERTH